MDVVIIMLLMKDVIQDGHPTLRLRAKDVKLPLSNEDLSTIREMMEMVENSQDDELMEKYDLRSAVGLAAPQINISKKMFCIKTWDEKFLKEYRLAVVNPKITSYSEEKTYMPSGEGCLSVDEDVTGLVKRSMRIKARVNLVDLETGELTEKVLRLSGFPAIVFQHEYDHLLGVMFTDKISQEINDVQPLKFGVDE